MARRRARQGHVRRVFVRMDQPFSLTKEGSAITLTIRSRAAKLGTLSVGRGSLVWWGRADHIGLKLSWRRFGAVMDRLKAGEI